MKGLATLSGASALQAAANSAAGLVATQALGPRERGLMVLGVTIGSICGLVGGLGSGAAFRAFLPAAPSSDARRRLVSTFTWCSLCGLVVALAGALATTAASSRWIDSALATPGFLGATASFTVGQVLLALVPDAWFADGRFRRGGMAAALVSAGGLAGVLAALTVSVSASVVLQAQASGMVLAGLAGLWGLRRAGLARLDWPEPARIRTLLRRGTPTLGLTVGLVVALRADRYFLGLAGGTTAVGIYSLAASLSETARLLPAAAGQLYLRDTSTGLGARRLRPATAFAVGAALAGGLIVVIAAWLFIVPVFGTEFAPARPLVAILAGAELCLAPYSVASRGLLGGGWTGAAGTLGIAGSAVALAVYAISADWAGALGVAIGSVLVYAGLSVGSTGILRRRVRTVKAVIR
ncbi:lipopolysaccharide biosynthesis protein [Amycolatopsis pithecellobii]|uniref:Oligosaccharide flippase family protein n=1 Tax=Amycolatopsis pithecellobii TaxID=664692 RepID=A0A6N7Z8R1_9PSEU|nr:oligosaccharide flippase family protein [Amycolatopsis pithecellobii]MTD58030.1 oligosaccharide flippase family protein [Amycolatopsis pithecellobii]